MKGTLTRVTALLITVMLVLSSVTVMADYEKKLYEIYELKDNYTYEDTLVGYALKSSVVKIENHIDISAEYYPVVFKSDVFVSDYLRLVQNNPNATMDDIVKYMKDNIVDYLYFENTKKTISDTLNYVGSGVVISEDGYIATNNHVVECNEEEIEDAIVESVFESIVEDLTEIVSTAQSWGMSFTEEDVESLYAVVVDAIATKFSYSIGESSLYVLMPTADGSTNYYDAQCYSAEVVRKGKSFSSEGLSQDGAILKINAYNLVAMNLSEEYPAAPTKLIAAGFPVASDAIFRSIGSSESDLAVTTTSGEVARIVDVPDTSYKAIQITNTISGGNSGGPSVDMQLNVEGLNTYNLTSDARYAYMVPAEFIRDQASGINLIKDEATKTYLLGLQALQEDYGRTAVECFERVRELQPSTPYIDELINMAYKKTDREAPKLKQSMELDPLVLVLAGVMLVGVILIIVIILIISSNNKKKRQNSFDNGLYSNQSSFSSGSSYNGGSSDGSFL